MLKNRMEENKINIKTLFIIAGAFVSYTIGAGFASGNEVLQFFGSWGTGSTAALIGGFLMNTVFCVCLYRAGQTVDFEKTSDIYDFFGGKALGWFFKLFVFAFVLGCFMMMFSGAGSLLNQFFGLPQMVGAIFLGIVAGIVVLGGLKTVENVLGYAGIVILAYVIIFGIVSLFHPAADFSQASGAADAVAEGKIWQANLFALPPLSYIPGLASVNNAFIEGILYSMVCFVTGFPFYLTLGRNTKSAREATVNGVVTSIAFYACVGFVLVILLSNFNSLTNPATGQMFPFPTLAAIDYMWPGGSWTYVVIIFIGIFTTASGYLWVITDWFLPGQVRTKKSTICILVLLVFGISLGGVLPFSQIINYMFPLTGLAGLVMLACVIVKTATGFKGYKGKGAKAAE